MSDAGITILDGATLKSIDLTLPESDVTITISKLLSIAESRASTSLLGISVPENIKSAAFNRLKFDGYDVTFRSTELDRDRASLLLGEYIAAIADELRDDPLVASILDGSTIRLFLEDEDDFAMLAENLFTDLDTEDKGKINKTEIRNALIHMGVEMSVPSFSDFPKLNDILKTHGAEGEGELGQAQFAELLQPILEDLADALAEQHVVVIQNVKIITGSKLRKFLADEKRLSEVIDKMLEENKSAQDGPRSTELIIHFLEEKSKMLGIPTPEENEAVALIYDSLFTGEDIGTSAAETDKADFPKLIKEILTKFAAQLDANPVFHHLQN